MLPAQLTEEYERGATIEGLAIRNGCGILAMRTQLEAAGVVIRSRGGARRRVSSRPDLGQVQDLYGRQWSMERIADALRSSPTTIHTMLVESGAQIRRLGRWPGELPQTVWDAIEGHCGGTVYSIGRISSGMNADVIATLDTATRWVVVKCIRANSHRAGAHYAEATVSRHLPPLAPRLLWTAEADGWLVNGFRHARGRPATIQPGSPDLPRVAATVGRMWRELTPAPGVSVESLADRWGELSAWNRLACALPARLDPWSRALAPWAARVEGKAVDVLHGTTLAHTDLHELNFLVDERVSVLDWARARYAAPWVDAAFMVIRLIAAGHTPQDAERWAHAIPSWRKTSNETQVLFAVEVLGVWEWLLHNRPMPHRARLTAAARRWARYRVV